MSAERVGPEFVSDVGRLRGRDAERRHASWKARARLPKASVSRVHTTSARSASPVAASFAAV